MYEIDQLRARIFELEAKQEKLIGWLVVECKSVYGYGWTFDSRYFGTAAECEAAIRAAIETPKPLA
jgi:hypothetical protein